MKALRLEKKFTLEELADALNKRYPNTVNFNKGKLSKWENEKEEPKLSSIRILADFYNIRIDDFYTEKLVSSSIEKIYNQLSPPRQKKVYNFANQELEEQKQEQANAQVIPIEKEENNSDEIYTFAAHSDDPDKTYTDEEISEIEAFLDQVKADYDKKHNK